MAHSNNKIFMRFLEIIARLKNGEALSVTKLSREFRVSERTIQRDFNIYFIKYLPLYQEKKLWKMEENFQFSCSIEDAAVQILLGKIINDKGGEFSQKAKEFFCKNYKANLLCTKNNPTETNTKKEKYYPLGEKKAKNSRILESKIEMKSYFDQIKAVHLVKNNNHLRTYLGIADLEEGEYKILAETEEETIRYNSIDTLFEDEWRILEIDLK